MAMMSPRLKLVVDGIFGIVPEFEGWFCQAGPRQIVQRDFQMLRKNSQQLDLLFHIQLVNGRADFDYTTHAENVSPVESQCKLQRRRPRNASVQERARPRAQHY